MCRPGKHINDIIIINTVANDAVIKLLSGEGVSMQAGLRAQRKRFCSDFGGFI